MSRPSNQAGVIRIFRSVSAGRQWLRNADPQIFSLQSTDSIQMRPGDEEPPIFFIPGASGSILELAPLVSELTVRKPVYAIAIKGHNQGETPDERIEDIAEHCISVITAIRATGPYLLMGYSFGGVVALEIAGRLNAAGHAVPLVVLLASYPSENIWPLRCHFEIITREIRASVRAIARYSWWGVAGHISNRVYGFLIYLLRIFFRLSPLPPVSPSEVTATARRVYLASLTALKNYHPSPYGGKVVLIAPLEKQRLDPETPARVWQKFSINVEVRTVSGSHSSVIDSHAATAATEISSLIEAVRSDLADAAPTEHPTGSPDILSRKP